MWGGRDGGGDWDCDGAVFGDDDDEGLVGVVRDDAVNGMISNKVTSSQLHVMTSGTIDSSPELLVLVITSVENGPNLVTPVENGPSLVITPVENDPNPELINSSCVNPSKAPAAANNKTQCHGVLYAELGSN